MTELTLDAAMMESIPDPATDRRLLPGHMVPNDNARRIRHYKTALRRALKRLPPVQREQIRLHYGGGLRKSEIARRQHVTCSAVTKSIRAGEKALRAYIELYMGIYNDLESEFLLRDSD